MTYEITKTYRIVMEADSLQDAAVADARKEIIWDENDVIALSIVEVPNE